MLEKAEIGTLVAIGLDALIALGLYKLYKSSNRDADAVKEAQLFEIGPNLIEKLESDGTLNYVCVEGLVHATGKVLRSHYGDSEGVIQNKSLVEHKSIKRSGIWSDEKKEIRDILDSVPFFLKSDIADEKVHVIDPTSADYLMDDLTVTYDNYKPNENSVFKTITDRIYGEMIKGYHEVEKMLVTGTHLLGIGKVVLDGNKIKLMPSSDGRYILTKLSKEEIIKNLERKAALSNIFFKIFLVVGGALTTYLLYIFFKKWKSKREHERLLNEVRLARAARTATRNQREGIERNIDQDDGSFDPSQCVICLSNPREVVLLNCGHVCLCVDCVGQLPEPRLCPICRQEVVRYVQTYTP